MSSGTTRQGLVLFGDRPAGLIEETAAGYRFTYRPEYLDSGQPISRSLPLRGEPHESRELFSFFRGLLPEGWYREIVSRTLKIDPSDEFGLLLGTCADCIGAVSVRSA